MIDLFGDENSPKTITPVSFESVLQDESVNLRTKDNMIYLVTAKKISNHPDYHNLLSVKENIVENGYVYDIPLRPVNSYILRHLLKKFDVKITPADAKILTIEANKIPKPHAILSKDSKYIEIKVPYIESYKEILTTLAAYPMKSGYYRIPITKSLDFISMAKEMKTSLPKILIDKSVSSLNNDPLPDFDGTMDSLKKISIGELNVVKADIQSYKSKSKNKKSMKEKMEDFGIATIYDLIHWLPRRYIDKSKPQEIRDLLPDEPSTIVGKINAVGDLPKNKGVRFSVKTDAGDTIAVNFWNQNWLKTKFPVGSQVLITGKLAFFNRTKQLNGSSIEYAKEASNLPIVPIYKQSESKGITTTFLLSAMRETFGRMGLLEIPEYLRKEDEERVQYSDAYSELHLPTDLENNKKVLNALAYYELVYMQLIIQNNKRLSAGKPGVSMENTDLDYQNKMIGKLPYTLTNSQQMAVKELNRKLADNVPSTTLLDAEVGSGKTIVAQSACLRAIESGYQSVLIGPTEVLARQLYNTFNKIVASLNEDYDDENKIRIEFYSGNLKATEKKKILSGIADGSVNIIVGTHSVLSDTVVYHNLGFIAIDEQQKFGAEQRSKLLSARPDGKIPDLLMQTATPIPRSTAQVFYGDIDMIMLTEKPPGRLPIITEWIQEDPNEILSQIVNPLWSDIFDETEKGNQTFIITPMVQDNDRIDAASVEKTYAKLKENFPDLRVAYAHGKMKQAEQNEVMSDFRDKKYDVLVASTVVEVGVDIPDATRVVILSADRLGASSLHQIRGRVGRNSKQSKCYLVSLGVTENSQMRLNSLVENEDGFEVAKTDLVIRGEGTMFGSNQSGASEMVFASLLSHGKWVTLAKNEAIQILDSKYEEEAMRDAMEKFSGGEKLM